jgi:arginine exporter protein ArgO
MLITIERNVETDIGGYEKLYGLPLSFISSNYAFTHHFDVYILAMFVDLILFFIVTLGLFKLIERIGIKLKTHWTFISLGAIVFLFWICFFAMITFESSFKLTNDFDFKATSSHIHLGSFPW